MTAPARPDLTLRVGFAGRRWGATTDAPHDVHGLRASPGNLDALERALVDVLETIERRLLQIAADPATCGPAAACFRAPHPPVLRLITGLAEGADQLVAKAFRERPSRPALTREFAAVLPCDVAAYRETRAPHFRADFDASLARCSYVLVLDGLCGKPHPDNALAKRRRARAYRAQSAYLLRQCDLLVALADTSEDGEAGGTLETVVAALDCQIPVVLVETQDPRPRLVTSTDALMDHPDHVKGPWWQDSLHDLLTSLLSGPGRERPSDAHDGGDKSPSARNYVEEFFSEQPVPRTTGLGSRRPTVRERLWTIFAKSFHSDESRQSASGPSDEPLAPFAAWRLRAAELSYHYTGLYRGAFAVNYVLGVVAVALATGSLAVMALQAAAGESHGSTVWQAAPAVAELLCIFMIFRNTHVANTSNWNDKAIGYRYLSERLRSAFYLPRVGSYRVPEASRGPVTSPILRQGVFDWLSDALIRHVAPLDVADPGRAANPLQEAKDGDRRILRVDAVGALDIARDRWMATQIDYHRRNAIHMNRMSRSMDNAARSLNIVVFSAVTIDLVVLLAGLARPPIEVVTRIHEVAGPWLLFAGAVLPAAVAAIHGIRFQSECRRLADRSSMMEALLEGHASRLRSLTARISRSRASPADDPGAWSHDALMAVEQCARALAEEVTEWSVLYAKEVEEP